MKEFRIICEIKTYSLKDTLRIEKFLKTLNVIVREDDAGCGRARFYLLEKL